MADETYLRNADGDLLRLDESWWLGDADRKGNGGSLPADIQAWWHETGKTPMFARYGELAKPMIMRNGRWYSTIPVGQKPSDVPDLANVAELQIGVDVGIKSGWALVEARSHVPAPDPLPATLPAGTRSTGGSTAASTLCLVDGRYEGMWCGWAGRGGSYRGSLLVESVDWSSVSEQHAKQKSIAEVVLDALPHWHYPPSLEPAPSAPRCSFCSDTFSSHDPSVEGVHRSCVAQLDRRPCELTELAKCLACSGYAVRGRLCAYCVRPWLFDGDDGLTRRANDAEPGQQAAALRLDAALKRDQPRTVPSPPHPYEAWSTAGDES